MLFNSFEFLLFLPIVFLLYWFIFNQQKTQNLLIVIASYTFYGWWDWRFLILIAITTLCSFYGGILIAQYEKKRKVQKGINTINIILNLAILCTFKYFNFFKENFQHFFQLFGWEVDWVTLDILLPVGISFYTFQALSYTIDVYQHKLKATHNIVAFFAFISFFPQLVAGPIERATSLLPQFLNNRSFNELVATDGMRQILWGLFKKLVVADNCARFVTIAFNSYQTCTGSALFISAILFSFQIYCDFSGYSDIAIGTAKLFGIQLMRNFHTPYLSRNIAEFWRRWHISLTTWFRDYVYIPLGGSHYGKWKSIRNTMVVFLLSGLWHGANWTFVIWGFFHALLFMPLLLFGVNKKYTDNIAINKTFPSFKDLRQMVTTFSMALIGWIIFRSDNINIAWQYLTRMFTDFISLPKGIYLQGEIEYFLVCCVSIFILLFMEWSNRNQEHSFDIKRFKTLYRWAIYSILLFLIIRYTGKIQTFIYFQF